MCIYLYTNTRVYTCLTYGFKPIHFRRVVCDLTVKSCRLQNRKLVRGNRCRGVYACDVIYKITTTVIALHYNLQYQPRSPPFLTIELTPMLYRRGIILRALQDFFFHNYYLSPLPYKPLGIFSLFSAVLFAANVNSAIRCISFGKYLALK